MSNQATHQSTHGPEAVPKGAWHFLLGLVALLAVLIASWIVKDL